MVYGVWTFLTAALAFAISAISGKYLIPFLHKLKYGQTILEEGPKWHEKKQGTPTMGGIMFILGICVSAVLSVTVFAICGHNFFNIYLPEIDSQKVTVFAGLAMAFCYGLVGFLDDYIKVVKKRNLGLTAKQKLVLQFGIAAIYLSVLAAFGIDTKTLIPFIGYIDLGFFYYIIAAVVIVGIVNAVNLTDGLDGLCGSVTFFAALFFMLIASLMSYLGVSAFSAAVAGGCLGFLVWNFYPAKVFMGDTGSLFLGGIVCAMAFALDMPILLLPVGIIYICEELSVTLQVSYFKLTHGKRLFKMSPIHHHFELCGWSEVKIVIVFSLVTVIFGILAFLSVMYGVNP